MGIQASEPQCGPLLSRFDFRCTSGFWGQKFRNFGGLTVMALCDRLTETGHVFNMKECVSLRDPLDKQKAGVAARKK